MSTSTQLMVAGTLAGDLINLLLFVIFALQLSALRRQVQMSAANAKLDHDRERRQATIDFYRSTLDKRSQMRLRLPDDRDRDAIADLTKMIAKDEDAFAEPGCTLLNGRASRSAGSRRCRMRSLDKLRGPFRPT